MSTFIIAIHVIVCIALILIVLLQTGKGADMGAVFGGGSSQTLFGSSGASTFLTKMTTGAAVIFMLTSLSLAYFSNRRPTSSIMPASTPAPAVDQESGAAIPGEGGAVTSSQSEGAPETLPSEDVGSSQAPSSEVNLPDASVPAQESPVPDGDTVNPPVTEQSESG